MYLIRGFLVDVRSDEVSMSWARATVAAKVEVVSVVGRDEPEVLALGFGALPDAPGHGRLQFMRSTQALVTILDSNREAHGVLHAVATPCIADATLHGSQCLAVRMAALETGFDKFAPDTR